MKFVSLDQFKQMWEMQDRLNTLTSGMNWPNLNQNWNLAIKSEVMEFFDYIGWKWWKTPDQTKKPTDLQARLELVDIWHFLLSDIIQKRRPSCGAETIYRELVHLLGLRNIIPGSGTLLDVQELDQLRINNFDKVASLSYALDFCGWTWQELYAYYIGKNVLNEFRQENGYKEGTYKKIWLTDDGHQLEDNVFLEEYINELILEEQFSAETLKSMLTEHYRAITS